MIGCISVSGIECSQITLSTARISTVSFHVYLSTNEAQYTSTALGTQAVAHSQTHLCLWQKASSFFRSVDLFILPPTFVLHPTFIYQIQNERSELMLVSLLKIQSEHSILLPVPCLQNSETLARVKVRNPSAHVWVDGVLQMTNSSLAVCFSRCLTCLQDSSSLHWLIRYSNW